MTGYIIRIKHAGIRVPLLYVLTPWLLLDFVISGLLAGEWRRLCQWECWQNTGNIWLSVHDGLWAE